MIHLLPTPHTMTVNAEVCKLDGLSILVAPHQDIRLYDAALTLQQELADLLGWTPMVATRQPQGRCIAITTAGTAGEGYTLTVGAQGINLVGEGPAGTFYAIQTLRQLLRSAQNCQLTGMVIRDHPAFSLRGIYHDVTRGKVPTLDTLKQLADTLAYYKINMLQLYIEDAFAFREYDGIMQPFEVLTPAEIRELDEYCHARFIELTPSISTFGHLYRLLQSPRYRHLCEYEDYQPTTHPWHEKMAHHTIDVSNPQSIQVIHSMIDQFAGLCRSSYFNICCDETFDLCKGKNAGKDVGEAYFGFVKQIIERVKYHGKRVMMWGDIVLQHPDLVDQLPDDTVMLNWDYRADPPEDNTAAFARAGFTQVVCPGTSSWNRWIEDANCGKGNISGMATWGLKHGVLGILTTNWGDYGNVCSINGALYGLTMGAQQGWHPTAPIEEEYEQTVSYLAYGQQVNMVDYVRRLYRCDQAASWGELIGYLGGRDYGNCPRPIHGNLEAIADAAAECDAVQRELSQLPTTQPVEDLLLAAKAIRTMLACFRYLLGEGEKPDVESFLADHRAYWLRDNKQSQLTWVEYTFRSL